MAKCSIVNGTFDYHGLARTLKHESFGLSAVEHGTGVALPRLPEAVKAPDHLLVEAALRAEARAPGQRRTVRVTPRPMDGFGHRTCLGQHAKRGIKQ